MGRTIMKKEDVKKYVDEQIESMDYAENFFELDSMDRMELILRCEAEFFISLDDEKVQHSWNTDEFVDYIYIKIIKKP
jgi:acyl carrier protein